MTATAPAVNSAARRLPERHWLDLRTGPRPVAGQTGAMAGPEVSPCRRGMPPRLCRTHWRESAGRGLWGRATTGGSPAMRARWRVESIERRPCGRTAPTGGTGSVRCVSLTAFDAALGRGWSAAPVAPPPRWSSGKVLRLLPWHGGKAGNAGKVPGRRHWRTLRTPIWQGLDPQLTQKALRMAIRASIRFVLTSLHRNVCGNNTP